MKIGLVCPYNMFQFAGGVQEVVLQLQAHLQAKGHQALIITPRPRKHYKNPPDNLIMVGRSHKMNTPFATMVDLGFEADPTEIEAILEREQFDILHFHEPWQPFLSRQILSRSNAINIATFHAKLPDTLVSKSLLNAVIPYTKSVLKYLHVYTAVSEAAADYVRTLTHEPIAIVPNGIDLERFKFQPKLKKKNRQKTIFYLGRLEKRKGVRYLLEAYALLRESHDDVKLIIAGNGVKKLSLEKYVDLYEIPDVSFIGYVAEDQKIPLMGSADVYCSPAIYGESFGIVLLEAMALGTPVVAGNNPGYASVMQGKGRLSLVNPESTVDFAQHLELMLYDEDVRNLWQKWALDYVKGFSFDSVADNYELLYKQALKIYA